MAMSTLKAIRGREWDQAEALIEDLEYMESWVQGVIFPHYYPPGLVQAFGEHNRLDAALDTNGAETVKVVWYYESD